MKKFQEPLAEHHLQLPIKKRKNFLPNLVGKRKRQFLPLVKKTSQVPDKWIHSKMIQIRDCVDWLIKCEDGILILEKNQLL
jgi:hypothetical protein